MLATMTRCAIPDCRHPDHEELLRCESFGAAVCRWHSYIYPTYSLCRPCYVKERAAVRDECNAVIALFSRAGAMDAGNIAAALIDIAGRLDNWDAGIPMVVAGVGKEGKR